jgi:hypothetical protein
MATRSSTRPDVDVAERGYDIVRLKREGASFREIAATLGISKSAAHRRYDAAMEQLPPVQDALQHRLESLVDVELLLAQLRPLVHDDEVRPSPQDVNRFLRAIECEIKLLRLDQPR